MSEKELKAIDAAQGRIAMVMGDAATLRQEP